MSVTLKQPPPPAATTRSQPEWAFYDFVTGAKTQVKAQFGDSSNEVQAMGLKKKSEYKKATKKKTP